jgi:hypothetical protein
VLGEVDANAVKNATRLIPSRELMAEFERMEREPTTK